jgi:hypothetical protein
MVFYICYKNLYVVDYQRYEPDFIVKYQTHTKKVSGKHPTDCTTKIVVYDEQQQHIRISN